jgi:hypothetical protein
LTQYDKVKRKWRRVGEEQYRVIGRRKEAGHLKVRFQWQIENGRCPSLRLFSAPAFARSVLDRTALGFAHRIAVFLFVQAKLALHSGFLVQHFPDRSGFIPAMFFIGERLEGPVEGKRKGDRNGNGFLISHAADRVMANMTEQEDSVVASFEIEREA